MVVFWSPYVMIFASVSLCDTQIWAGLINSLNQSKNNQFLISFLKHLVLVFVLVVLYQSHKESILTILNDLKEFWDPDTVDLMEWILQNTPTSAAFAGTMQLLAGVRLCTGRPITNHPHFEDKNLRLRTKELYQIYGQISPEDVYDAMIKFNASFVILEDSQCLGGGRTPDRCSLPDTIDLTYGHVSKF
jgi:hypothetical protein